MFDLFRLHCLENSSSLIFIPNIVKMPVTPSLIPSLLSPQIKSNPLKSLLLAAHGLQNTAATQTYIPGGGAVTLDLAAADEVPDAGHPVG